MMGTALYILFALSGAAIGYWIGAKYDLSGLELIYEIAFGAALGSYVRLAVAEKYYGMLLGAITGLAIALSLDLIAGSPPDLRNKLSFAVLGSNVGVIWVFWKQMLVGGFLGAIAGFVWGLLDSHWFGQICLPPGILNASLLGVQMSMVGMLFGGLYMGYFGYRSLQDHQ